MKPFETLEDIRHRAADAIIAQTGLRNAGLKALLRDALSGRNEGGLIQEPVLEAAHPFIPADVKLKDVPSNVLHPAFVRMLDELPSNNEYRFPGSRTPFLHQIKAWETLADRQVARSVLVTSGTGSGKTECFLFPILSDLTAQVEAGPLEGVQAIMLYPLNALIESQRLRLSAWTAPKAGKLRYCLYNGDLEEHLPASVHRQRPEEVADRAALRASPPPILVTNVTMLEYMLARGKDQSIIEKSRGKLKWIVLDEAHSYVGAAAAEIALLLRRVLLAFNVEPKDVRFIATSATIGAGVDVLSKLKRFLAEIGGIRDDQVEVIVGDRRLPTRPAASSTAASDLRNLDAEALYNSLGGDNEAWTFISTHLAKTPQLLSSFARLGQRFGLSPEDMATELARARIANEATGDIEYLAPLRIHAFERAVPGIWSCLNPKCSGRRGDWPFGRLMYEKTDHCPSCHAPILEIVSCIECGTPMLDAMEDTGSGSLASPSRHETGDEFATEAARESDDDGEDLGGDDETAAEDLSKVSYRIRYLLSATPGPRARTLHVDPQGWTVHDAFSDGCITFRAELYPIDNTCPCCEASGKKQLLRPLRFGAPSMVPNAAPLLLDGVASREDSDNLPARGRGLLSFTDSRQGTARLSAKMQAEAERNFIRSFVYHSVQQSLAAVDVSSEESAKLIEQLTALRAIPPNQTILELITDLEKKLAKASQPDADGIPWTTLVDRLAARQEVDIWIKAVWEPREPLEYSDSYRLANFLLLRELDRRPRRGNSLETLGLARLRFPVLAVGQVPHSFIRAGKTAKDWSDYLHAVITHFIRANRAIDISLIDKHWVMPGYNLRSLVNGDVPARDRRFQRWPQLARSAGNLAGPIGMLVRGLNLDISDSGHRDDIEECMSAAWNQLQRVLGDDPERRGLDFKKAYVAPVETAFLCPMTNRVLDVAPFGFTPYGRSEKDLEKVRANPIEMPRHPMPLLGLFDSAEAVRRIRDWLNDDEPVGALRLAGAWNNISDRVARFAQYVRSAEHSAQQSSQRLRRYEDDFKAGRINILNCSTTMEMGVDIGSVSTVMMTNVPPHIANYRQRVGRAGRRGQALALAFTFCKDRPLDREAFREPLRFLTREVAPPKVALSSRPIVQRHVNAFLLRAFIRQMGGDTLKMEIGAFLGCPVKAGDPRVPADERPSARFLDWLSLPGTRADYQQSLQDLVARSVLEGETRLIDDTADAITQVEAQFVDEWESFRRLVVGEAGSKAEGRIGAELHRLCAEFLLSALADYGFLPGHGFPNSVVTFIPGRRKDEKQGSDGGRHLRDLGPQRSLDLAIRDYAPGSEVVLDGLVHLSAGLTLNWKRPASEEKVAEVQSLKTHWKCTNCGSAGSDKSWPDACEDCGSSSLICEEYIRPAGFTVDPRIKPHSQTDIITYVPAEEPEVSTRNATWVSLPWTETGRQRHSRQGRVFYANKGPGRHGYALCLHCGRAEAEAAEEDALPLVEHKPLRWANGETTDICAGNENPWKIRRHLTLGFEISTDVFELQLAKSISDGAANALIIALREGLARRLGVEADEMGYSVRSMPGPYGSLRTSLLLFDKASGGAGFSITLDSELVAALHEAKHILNCRAGCSNACAACVLTSDAPEGENRLDRFAALAYLSANFGEQVVLAPDDQITPEAELSLSTVNEIDRELRLAIRPTLAVYLPDEADPAALASWSVVSDLAEWSYRGYRVNLAVHGGWLDRLDVAARLTLRDFVMSHKLQLVIADDRIIEGAGVFASVVTEEGTHVWACRCLAAALPGAHWGRAAEAPVVRAYVLSAPKWCVADLEKLLPRADTKVSIIEKETEVMLQVWGKRMADRLRNLLSDCGIDGAAITRITYRDPYVRSPLTAKLFIDAAAALLAPGGTVKLLTRSCSGDRPPFMIWNDWQDPDEAAAVIKAYAQRKKLTLELLYTDVPHGRYMELELTSGDHAQLILDQGFGAWSVRRGLECRFDGRAPVSRQAENLERAQAPIARTASGPTYVVAARDTVKQV